MGRRKKEGVFDTLVNAMMIIGSILIVLDVLLVSFGTFARFFFNFSRGELIEITEYTLLWITFLGTTWLLRERGHVTIELIVSRISTAKREKLHLIILVTSALLIGILLIYSVRVLLFDLMTKYHLAGVLRPPKWPIEIIIPIGFLLMLLEILRQLYRSFKGL